MAAATPAVQLAGLQTETCNPRTTAIDRVSTEQLCRILHREDATISAAIEPCIPVIAQTIEALSERVRRGGRIFYIGAGTSGRLGVLDASEIPPTYSAPPDTFVALIAGGDYALRHAKEGAEDSRSAAEEDLAQHAFDPRLDSLIGIASSGRTPYVLGGLAYVRSVGGVTGALVCVEPSAVAAEGNADFLIAPVTGPEAVTGSTRMKAGTATKLVLNMISTGVMVSLGKTYGNLMVDLRATNIKLKQRAKNIIRFIAGDKCTPSDDELESVLDECHGSVKLAAAKVALGVSVAEAEARLAENNGVLAKVFENELPLPTSDGVVLCVDAGGSSCKAVVMAKDGSIGRGCAGPCNVSVVGLAATISAISTAVQTAIDGCPATQGRNLANVSFASVWVGIAGHDRPSLSTSLRHALSELLSLPLGERLKLTADTDLLPASATLDSVIVLVAGTGSVAMAYDRTQSGYQRVARVGGWGHVLGDDGAGFVMGRGAVRQALAEIDAGGARSPLAKAVIEHFDGAEDLLSAVVAQADTAKRVAGVAEVVLGLAASDDDAKRLVKTGVESLVQLVDGILRGRKAGECALVLAGGLLQHEVYKKMVMDEVEARHGAFGDMRVVSAAAEDGARLLLRHL